MRQITICNKSYLIRVMGFDHVSVTVPCEVRHVVDETSQWKQI